MDVHLDPHSERLIEQQLRFETLAEEESPASKENQRSQAVRDMLDFAGKHRFTLGEGVRIRDLIHEQNSGTERASDDRRPKF